MGDLLLVRHGQTEWSRTHMHTGRTDVPLTAYGERQAASLAPLLQARDLAAVWTSPLQRARRTAELAGATPRVDEDLIEWDNGEYEGRSTAQIREDRAGWWLWTDGAPGGEDWQQVGARCARTLERVAPDLERGDVALFGHGHSLRALAAVWVGLEAHAGGLFTLDEASLSVLGHYRGHRVVKGWNDVTVHPPEHG
ncbi:MAG TPA: histidine phosphatase family protein [Mycobacteriales bacterium]|nr:histidine phosphatase family protein [Mycobacteriales bacterium]